MDKRESAVAADVVGLADDAVAVNIAVADIVVEESIVAVASDDDAFVAA